MDKTAPLTIIHFNEFKRLLRNSNDATKDAFDDTIKNMQFQMKM